MTTKKEHDIEHFITTADWHTGLIRYSRDEEGVPGRHKELLTSIEFIVDYAIDTGAKFIVVNGDICHTNQPSQLYYADLIPIFLKASNNNLVIILFPGNHDAINTIPEMNSLRTLFKAEIPRLHVINGISCNTVILPDYNLLFIPHINRCEYSVFNLEAEKKLINSKIKALNLNTDKKTIVFGHAMLEGSIQGSERLVMRGGEQTFKGTLPKNTIACFFGHMHTPQQGKYKGVPYYYPGSIQAVDFGERDDRKSFMDVTLDDDLQTKRVEIPTRRCVQEEFTYDEYTTTIRDTSKHAKKIDNCIVKIVLNISSEDRKSINEQRIYDYYKAAYWVEISYNVTKETATRNKDVNSETDPDKAFENWYDSKKYPAKDKKEIMTLHSNIMAKVTIVEE